MNPDRTLKNVKAGETAMIIAVNAGYKAMTRLESMGLIPGTAVDVLNNGNGPMIISLGEGRIMVEQGIANKVLVA